MEITISISLVKKYNPNDELDMEILDPFQNVIDKLKFTLPDDISFKDFSNKIKNIFDEQSPLEVINFMIIIGYDDNPTNHVYVLTQIERISLIKELIENAINELIEDGK